MRQQRPPSRGSESVASVRSEAPAGMAARVSRIVGEFGAADLRMRDLPIYNPALRVEAWGFREWNGTWLGVIITPWFMNLVLIPIDAEARSDRSAGDRVLWSFPSGCVEFIVGAGDSCGPYQCRSLFSPVFEFRDQEAARQTARAALAALMDPDLFDHAGETPSAADAPNASGPVNRRQLLRADLSGRQRW